MALKKKRPVRKSGKKAVKSRIKKRPVCRKADKRAAKKKPAKKTLKKSVKKPKAAVASVPKADIIGVITHYFPKVRAAVVKLNAPLTCGNLIRIKGHTTDFTQSVSSIQIDHSSVDVAKKGQEVGLLVNSRVRQHDVVIREK